MRETFVDSLIEDNAHLLHNYKQSGYGNYLGSDCGCDQSNTCDKHRNTNRHNDLKNMDLKDSLDEINYNFYGYDEPKGPSSISVKKNKKKQGIKKNTIPGGDEDLYILKSEIVPPVCPVCPSSDCPRQKPCPTCPPCGRCPEPAFECKKVPNYNSSNKSLLPRPYLNDFSAF